MAGFVASRFGILFRQVHSLGYRSNDMQVVTAEDAVGLADALERALSEMPVEDNEVEPVSLTIHSSQHSDLPRILAEHAEVVSQWNPVRGSVMELIAVCRAGSFTVG